VTAPYSPPKLSILDRLQQRLFPSLGMLDPQAGQAVGRQGLLQLGTNLLQAGGASAQQGGTLANIGRAIGGVDINDLTQQAMRLQAYQQQQRTQAQVAGVAQKAQGIADPYQRVAQMVSELAGQPGTEDLVGKLSNVLAQLKPERPDRGVLRAGLVDPKTGKPVLSGGVPALLRFYSDGRIEATGAGAFQQTAAGQIPTESERRAGALHMVAEQAYELLQQATAPSLEQAAAAQLPFGLGNTVVSGARQQQNQAALQLAQSYNYVVSGAASTEAETQRTAQTFLPQVGDKPETLRQKALARERAIQAIRLAAGRSLPKQAPVTVPDEEDNFDDMLPVPP